MNGSNNPEASFSFLPPQKRTRSHLHTQKQQYMKEEDF